MSYDKQEGIASVPWIAKREQTIATLVKTARVQKTVIIRSPPFTGKTSLCQLLVQFFENISANYFFINFLQMLRTENFEQFFKRISNCNWEDVIVKDEEIFIFTDETQGIFSLEERFATFWRTVKFIGLKPSISKLRIIIFAPFVDITTGFKYVAPVKANYCFGINFSKCSVQDEREMFSNFYYNTGIRLSTRICDVIVKEASHHIGLISAILDKIQNTFCYFDSDENIMEKKILELLFSFSMFKFICSTRGSPSFMMETLSEQQKEILTTILAKGHLRVEAHLMKDVHKLLELGYIWYKDEKNQPLEDDVKFTSTVMRRITLQFLSATTRGKNDFFSLSDFMLEFLKNVNPSIFLNSKSVTKENGIVERFLQMEFYKLATSLLPNNNHVSPYVGRVFGESHAIDLYVNDDKKWLVEFLIEGDGLEETLNRFSTKGSYSNFPYNDHLIVDFRKTTRKPNSIQNKHYWCVMVDESNAKGLLITETESKEILFRGDQVQIHNTVYSTKHKILYVRIGTDDNTTKAVAMYKNTVQELDKLVKQQFIGLQSRRYLIRVVKNSMLFPLNIDEAVAKLTDESILQIDLID